MLINYCAARLDREQQEKAYRVYVTDVLRGIVGGKCDRYLDWIDRRPMDNRTGAEIAADVIKKAGLAVKKDTAS